MMFLFSYLASFVFLILCQKPKLILSRLLLCSENGMLEIRAPNSGCSKWCHPFFEIFDPSPLVGDLIYGQPLVVFSANDFQQLKKDGSINFQQRHKKLSDIKLFKKNYANVNRFKIGVYKIFQSSENEQTKGSIYLLKVTRSS